jgi:hypothetical protein
MFGQLLRVLIGYLAACLGAGLTMVLFVVTPSELAGLPPDVASDRMGRTLELATYVAAQAFLFAAPFALVIAAVGEWRRSRSWTFYALAGLLIALLGFLAQHSTEQTGQPTIVNNYAAIAFMTSGFVGGLLYWLFSGRMAGGRDVDATGRAVATTTGSAGKPAGAASAGASKPSGGSTKPASDKAAEPKGPAAAATSSSNA